MKKLSTLILAVAVAVGCAFGKSPVKGKGDSVVVISDRLDIVYFKVGKEMIGGVVEVFNDSHELVASQSIKRKKVLLDFIYAKPGVYSILIKKESIVEEFLYQVVPHKSDIRVSGKDAVVTSN